MVVFFNYNVYITDLHLVPTRVSCLPVGQKIALLIFDRHFMRFQVRQCRPFPFQILIITVWCELTFRLTTSYTVFTRRTLHPRWMMVGETPGHYVVDKINAVVSPKTNTIGDRIMTASRILLKYLNSGCTCRFFLINYAS